MHFSRIVHLYTDDVSLLLVQVSDELPVVRHWGERIHGSDLDLATYADSAIRSGIPGPSDVPYTPSILPEHSRGWSGLPGLRVHRAGAGWSPSLSVEDVVLDGSEVGDGTVSQQNGGVLTIEARDKWAGFSATLEIDLQRTGLLRVRAAVRNDDQGKTPLDVVGVDPALKVPVDAREVLDFTGRWGTEKIPQRHSVVAGAHTRTSRRGRTGLDATTVVAIGTQGFDAQSGHVWLCHVGIGGNHEYAVERTDGHLTFRGGELLLPGEVRLLSGQSYQSPWIYGSFGVGLDDAAARFHNFLRERSRSSTRPRPVTLNVWEAVYFDQDFESLSDLATQAGHLGVERYVLDDGWFMGRHDATAGLGDWAADPVSWPDGLPPLAEHVRGAGMEFGLWVEPEMINENSDLARAHPEWILRARENLPIQVRNQQVLDLTNQDAYAHIRGILDALITDLGLAYLKWDHNRDLVDAGHPSDGTPAVHAQTLAVYRLLDDLRDRHPALEIESCASGGGRIDLGILGRTDRVHTSDNQDPLDRARMLRWTGMLVPPEMLGSHVASPVSSVTGRTHDLHTRCAVAFLGHFGVEWDIRELDQGERTELATWIGRYKEHRQLISTGRVVGGGDFDSGAPFLRGIVAPDGSEAIYTVLTPGLSADSSCRLRFPGLNAAAKYRVEAVKPESLGAWWLTHQWLKDAPALGATAGPGHVSEDTMGFSGSLLGTAGLDLPSSRPDQAIVLRFVRIGS